jgi:hypothetical protein
VANLASQARIEPINKTKGANRLYHPSIVERSLRRKTPK